MTLKEHGESRTMMSNKTGIKEPLIYFFVAAMLVYLPTAFEMLMITVFSYPNVLAYTPTDSNNSVISSLFGSSSTVGPSLATIIQTIGLIAFIRGWVLVARSASQGQSPGGMGKGITHVLGGILAMNIVYISLMNSTLTENCSY